jgi:hypothetical protein
MQNKLPSGAGLLAAVAALNTVQAVDPSSFLLYTKGPLALKPQFGLTETFNDNVTYRSDHLQSDFITSVSPGLALQIGRRDFNVWEFSYLYERLIYADLNEFDANQHHITSHLHFGKSRLTLEARDTVDFYSSPLGGGYSSGANTGSGTEGVVTTGAQVDRLIIADTYRLTWDTTERTDFYGQIQHSLVDYQDDLPFYDSRTLTGTLGFEYHPFAKAYFFGETYFGETDNDRNLDISAEYPKVNFVGFFVGTRGNFTEKFSGTVKAGYEHRYYTGSVTQQLPSGATVERSSEPIDSPVVEISLEERLSDNTQLMLSYYRHTYESIQFVASPYTTDSINFSWLQKIGADGRLNGAFRATYHLSNFQNTGPITDHTGNRTDNLFNASLTITYDIKLWMRAFGTYSFEHLDSNVASIVDYNANRVMLGLQIGY